MIRTVIASRRRRRETSSSGWWSADGMVRVLVGEAPQGRSSLVACRSGAFFQSSSDRLEWRGLADPEQDDEGAANYPSRSRRRPLGRPIWSKS